MKKFARTLTVALTALCLSVCFLFAGCSKQAGTYTGSTLITQKSVELKLKINDKFTLSVDGEDIEGTWEVSEDDKTSIVLTFEGGTGTAKFNEEEKSVVLAIATGNISDAGIYLANGAKLYKK